MISFIITSYNRYDELKALFDSLDAQTSRDFEALIVDDNSSDLRIRPLCEQFLERHGGIYTQSDVLDENRKKVVRYAENINYLLSIKAASGSLIAYLCDDVVLAPEYVDTVQRYFHKHPEALAGYVAEEWVENSEQTKLLWYNAPVGTAFCALDHSQVVHRAGYEVPWVTHPLAWAFADGIAFERLLGRVGVFYPIGTEKPLVTNKILTSSVSRQPIENALERYKDGTR